MEKSHTDKATYAPFILLESQEFRSLMLSDLDMEERFHVFEERSDEGWSGNGYDWNSIAQVIMSEQLPDLMESISFDPEAGMFSAQGPRAALERLGAAMSSAFRDEEILRDLLSRAELD
ncbi:Imm51 family immunity protein [Azovibrio restrictus]|uniref:Imm51 family immunity protein n=1 Tax=Azovibrio restrictus TaxID=146938 RepID=UPI0026EB0689|nr:Imm51 family immunity protein [Azovibrio restrictus]MDD3484179.1 Imm51 family immunity protein [Azovibrio restrictus]